jgi:hypothetical protein
MTWRTSANQLIGAAAVADIDGYLHDAAGPSAPIDTFYADLQHLLSLGTPDLLARNESLGPLLLVGMVSRTENYFRDLFGRIIRICPIASAASADHVVKLGSVIWHGGVSAERGAFEHISFSGGDVIQSTAKKVLKYDLKASVPLREFDKVCELRHGIVHASGMMAGINAVKLQVRRRQHPVRIQLGYSQVQECALICTALVTTLNSELFVEFCRRWAVDWRRLPAWDPLSANKLFRELWFTFISTIDSARGSIPTPMGMVKCRNRIVKELA